VVGGAERILLDLALILLGAKLGGLAAARLRQPPIIGEILVGVLIGPSVLRLIPPFEVLDSAERYFHALAQGTSGTNGFTPGDFPAVQELAILALLAELGVLILLFEVGLESSLAEFRRIGPSAVLVGTYGVVFSLIAGAAGSYLLARQIDWVLTPNAQAAPNLLHAFIGATLTATSVGITARVLTDMKRVRTREAQIILGAAVFDDVLGLIVLAIVGGLVVNPGGLSALGVARVFALALGFFFAAILVGVLVAPRLLRFVHRRVDLPYAHLGAAIIFMLVVAYLATWVGLAAIVGAFAAGLALSGSEHRHVLLEHVKPVGSLFVGIFFVVLGIRVDLSQVTRDTLPLVLGVGLLLAFLGVLAKLLCGLGVVRANAHRFTVGVGMVPRGEVGLIFALFGLEHELLTNWQYTTIIIVVLLTTFVTPFWLKALDRRFTPLADPAPGAARVAEAESP
jgi:Na+:H+ antiporter